MSFYLTAVLLGLGFAALALGIGIDSMFTYTSMMDPNPHANTVPIDTHWGKYWVPLDGVWAALIS
mgnify:CR=1 FL=1